MRKNQSITLGVIVGNRNFFPDALVAEGRREVLEVLAECNIEPVILDEQSTKLGGLETWRDAKKCAALFDEQRH
jgi:L-fucose isomerase-like protein